MLDVRQLIKTIWNTNYKKINLISFFTKKLNQDNIFYKQYFILIYLSSVIFLSLFGLFIIDLFTKLSLNIITLSAIGIFLSAFLTITNHFYMKEEKKIESKQKDCLLIDNLINGLIEELNILWNTYYDNVGIKLENHIMSNSHKMFYCFYPIESNYFNIYSNNTNLITKIDNQKLRSKIIEIYIKALGLIDSFKFNNRLLEKYETLESHSIIHKQYEIILNEYAKTLYKLHADLKNELKIINNIKK